MSEAANSAMSSYSVASNGVLTVISGSVLDGQKDACWAAITNSSTYPTQYAYTTNTGSANISGYSIGTDGSLTLLSPPIGTPHDPLDMSQSADGRFLYALGRKAGAIVGYCTSSSGTLTRLGTFTVPTSSNGVAAY